MRPWQVWRHRLGTAPADDVARVPGGRRPLLRGRRSHPQRTVRRDQIASKVTSEVWLVDADDPASAPRRRGTARAGPRVPRRAPRRPGRRPAVRAHQRRRRRELRADGHAGGDARDGRRGRRSSPTATTPASTTSTRSPASWWCPNAPTRSSGCACSPRRRRRDRRRPRAGDARAGLLGLARRQPRVRHDGRCATSTRRW